MTDAFAKREYAASIKRIVKGEVKKERDIWEELQRIHFFAPHIWKQLGQYEPEDISCRIFGHVCPVFFIQSGATETKEGRREGRFIPRDIMLKVVRRDNHVCQQCYQYVPDDELEFDHIIPVAKGGPTTVANLRLLCRTCNRKKSSALGELLAKQHGV